jgi:hypothetical protein
MLNCLFSLRAANVTRKHLRTPFFKEHAVVPWVRVAVIAEIKLNIIRYWFVPKSGTLERSTIQMFAFNALGQWRCNEINPQGVHPSHLLFPHDAPLGTPLRPAGPALKNGLAHVLPGIF